MIFVGHRYIEKRRQILLPLPGISIRWQEVGRRQECKSKTLIDRTFANYDVYFLPSTSSTGPTG